jgi:hypothetical protein
MILRLPTQLAETDTTSEPRLAEQVELATKQLTAPWPRGHCFHVVAHRTPVRASTVGVPHPVIA